MRTTVALTLILAACAPTRLGAPGVPEDEGLHVTYYYLNY